MNIQQLISKRIIITDSAEMIYQTFLDNGWTDGLPFIPPTEEAVAKMLTQISRDPREVVAVIPPKWGEATIEKIAINAVMAGCLPEYMPVIIAALKAMAEPRFNLSFVQPTTHPCAPLVIVNGPVAKELKINSRSGTFGPGFRSNATIGRAIRLILLNIGGAIPGDTDMSTQGQPSKFSFCIAENEDENPWQPLHVEKGYDISQSTVTVVAAENPRNINDHSSTNAVDMLSTFAGNLNAMSTNNMLGQGGNPILALAPEHAATIAREGYSKDDIKDYMFKNATLQVGRYPLSTRQRFFPNKSEDDNISLVAKKEDLIIIVVGGPGKHSSYLPSSAGNWSVTKPIE